MRGGGKKIGLLGKKKKRKHLSFQKFHVKQRSVDFSITSIVFPQICSWLLNRFPTTWDAEAWSSTPGSLVRPTAPPSGHFPNFPTLLFHSTEQRNLIKKPPRSQLPATLKAHVGPWRLPQMPTFPTSTPGCSEPLATQRWSKKVSKWWWNSWLKSRCF